MGTFWLRFSPTCTALPLTRWRFWYLVLGISPLLLQFSLRHFFFYYLSQIPIHVSFCGFVIADECFHRSNDCSMAGFWICSVWMREVYDHKPTKIDPQKGAGVTFVFLLHVAACFSSKELDLHFKKESSSSSKNTAQDQSALVFSPCYIQRLLWCVGLVTFS